MTKKPFAERTSIEQVEEGVELAPKFDARGLVPCVTTDATTGDVLMMGYMNDEALLQTIATGEAHYWSRSRQCIWHKGATSGDVLDLVEVAVNCEQNSLIYKVRKAGTGVCHTKDEAGQTRQTCYYRAVEDAETLRFT